MLSIDVEPGLVKAKVQGSQPRPYSVTIRLKPLSDDDWEQVTQAMAAQALFAAKLLAGEMPTNIEEAFASVHISLFPTSARDLSTDCSCPDWANPCKHIAAVYYLLAERFDEDPFLIFKLRGRTKEQIIETLREKRAVSTPAVHEEPAPEADEAEPLLPLEADLETFWRAGEGLETFAVNPAAPTVERALLKRLGDAPFSVKGQNVASLLGRAYDVVESVVRERLAGEDTA